MVVTAHTPESQGLSESRSDVAIDAGEASAPGSSSQQSGSQQSSSQQSESLASNATSSTSDKRRLSTRIRFIAAGVLILLTGLSALALLANPGEQPIRLIAFVNVVAACAAVLAELVFSWLIRPRRHSSFDAIALAGAALIIAGALVEILATQNPEITVMLVVAPALAAAGLCFGSACAALGRATTRQDQDYLFPRPLSATTAYTLGQTVAFKAGQMIPVDGRIELGSVGVDERAFNPLPTFKVREEQEVVFAGSEIISGSADVKVLATGRDSCLGQMQSVIAPIVQESEQSLHIEDQKAARWTALTLVFLATAAAISWNERSVGYTSPLMAAGMVALIATLCQVSEWLYGQRRSLVRSWLLKGFLLAQPTTCKDLSRVSRVECDPSRLETLAPGSSVHLEVLDDRLSPPALCDILASLLGRAEDPILVAAGDYCRRNAHTLSLERVIDLREYAPRGICGTVHGIELSVGDEDFLVERGIMVQPTEGALEALDEGHSGERTVLVAIDDDVVARFRIATTQEQIASEGAHAGWNPAVEISASSGVARELGAEVLLVRGRESDLIGQTAHLEVSLFSPQEGAIRRTSVVAFTPALLPLSDLLGDCRAHIRALERCRLLVGFGGLVTVAAAFSGIFTPAIPLAWLIFLGASVRVASVRLSQPLG